MNAPFSPGAVAIPEEFKACLEAQRRAHLAGPAPSVASRVADLTSLGRMIEDNKDAIVAAISADFGNRAAFETLFTEVFVALSAIKATKPRIRGWVRPRARTVDLLVFPGARNRLIPQPLGVVGVLVPWNFPLLLSFMPLVSIFAAGNRAMVKMSEHSRRLTELLMKVSSKYFPSEKLRFFDDDGSLGPAFTSLQFDHLLFTGSTNVGRAVMASAARNLTPVTLELGGKSPAIVGPDYPIKTAAERIMWAKMLNAGQVCMTVDYVFLPRGSETEFVDHAKRLVAARYPDLDGDDYTSIVDDRFFQRLQRILDDARAKGASVINLAQGRQPDAAKRKFAPHVILNPSEDMEAMSEEIFGPILPIRTYGDKQEVIDYLNAHERPLALYPFTKDPSLRDFYIARTMSGGVGVNEAILQLPQTDMPFGGVGPSGMGHYQAREGFDTFSKLRPVFQQGPLSPVQMLFQPPYNARTRWLLNMLMWLKR